MKKILITLGGIVLIIYIVTCSFLFMKQERFIFYPKKLASDYEFSFPGACFEEHNIKATDGNLLSGLLFKADSTKGLVFYLHGNAGALDTWVPVTKTYTALGYDVFIWDYRGFGKSEGTITSEKQFYDDIRAAYSDLKQYYPEDHIIIIGYSIGTGPAAMLAAETHPKMLILLAPYFSLTDMMKQRFSFVPSFLLNYKFTTYEFLQKSQAPVLIFHGDSDHVINYEASIKLKKYFKPSDQLIILKGQEHNGMNENKDYIRILSEIL